MKFPHQEYNIPLEQQLQFRALQKRLIMVRGQLPQAVRVLLQLTTQVIMERLDMMELSLALQVLLQPTLQKAEVMEAVL